MLAQKLTANGWPPVVIENHTGGGGTLAALEVKRAAPDGYTLLLADIGSHAVSPALMADAPYDPLNDFTPITLTWSFPSVLAVPTSSSARSMPDLVALAKTKAGGLNYASPGPGSGGHLLGAMLARASGTAVTHVPYKGAGPAVLDLIAGNVDMMFASYGSLRSAYQTGQLRLLAVTSRSRLESLPTVPTMTEAGFPDVFLDAWFGLVGPAGLSPTIVDTIREATTQVMSSSEMREELKEQQWNLAIGAPKQFREVIAVDSIRLRRVLEQVGLVPASSFKVR
jgi:tripartite-type tricarboxylate transporter receptor subunit TctC